MSKPLVTTVFVSHSSKDSEFAAGYLKSLLEGEGSAVWCSSVDMPVGLEWEEQIRRALSWADWFVVVLSPEAACSDWVRAEAHWALENRPGRVIPVMLESCEPSTVHLKLGRLQYLDFRTDPLPASAKLVSILRRGCLQAPTTEDETGGPTMVLSGLPRARILIAVGSSSGSGKDEERVVDINGHCVIGRATDVDFRIAEPSVSRRHAQLSVVMEKEVKRLQIADLESANGTYVNGQRISAPHAVNVGDTVELGATRLRLRQIL
jgi:hypothetical protein